MRKIFLTSDTHFNHEMLAREQKRPFKTTEAMNDFIISKWNSIVTNNDIVYHLGDIALNKKVEFEKFILPKLNGNIVFIRGNHDPLNLSIIKNIIIEFKKNNIELVHRPKDATQATKIICHGHIHRSGIRTMAFKGQYMNDHIFITKNNKIFFNVNLEYHKYKPITINDIIGQINIALNKPQPKKRFSFNITKIKNYFLK